MAAYDYQAIDSKGKKVSGVMEGDGPRVVRQLLREKGLLPTEVHLATEKRNKSSWSLSGKVSAADLALLTRQLATLVQSGIPVEQSLKAVANQSESPRIRSMMTAVRSKVLEGHTLADSLSEYPRVFPKLYRSTVSAGEQSGHLDLVLNKLADYTEQRQESRQKIQLAAIYPLILSFVSLGIVIFLMTYVVPGIIEVFVKQGQDLPFLTKALLAASSTLVNYGLYVVVILVVAMIAFKSMMKRDTFRKKMHKRLLHVPFLKPLVRGINTARYVSTLSILSTSGVPLTEAMKIASEVISNEHLSDCLKEATKKVREGGSLSKALEATGYFPSMMIHMIASGESSGELDHMLDRSSRMQENTLQAKVSAIVGLFEPMMLLVMGGVVLIIVMAVMLPILNMSSLIG